MTKSKLQALHVIRIKYSEGGNPPSLILALWIIGILLHKERPPGPNISTASVCTLFIIHIYKNQVDRTTTKVRSSYGPLTYFPYIFILKHKKNKQADHNLNGL